MVTRPGSIPWLLMIVAISKIFSIGNPEQSSRLTAGGFFIFCNLPLLVDFDIIIDTGNGVIEMRIPVDQLKPGMFVNITHYDGEEIEFYAMRVHAYIPHERGVVVECGPTMGTAAIIAHDWNRICQRAGYPMDLNKRYAVFCSLYRAYYAVTLDKKAISTLLVRMQGE